MIGFKILERCIFLWNILQTEYEGGIDMNEYCLNRKNIETYLQYLREQEKSTGTLENINGNYMNCCLFFYQEKMKVRKN